MARLAFYTIGVLHDPQEQPEVQTFFDVTPGTFARAEASAGFIALADDEAPGQPWGEPALPPRFELEEWVGFRVSTLSLWQDLESVFAFAYHGQHGWALSERKRWFRTPQFPTYVAWWIADDHTPTWSEACARYTLLDELGPTPDAFDFKRAFGPGGEPVKLDRARARALGARQPAPLGETPNVE